MDRETAKRFAAHWAGLNLDNLRDVVPVRVTISLWKRVWTFYGVRMTQVYAYLAGERAVTEGLKQAGEQYTRERILLLGLRNKDMSAKDRDGASKLNYRRPGDDGDWYVSHYFDGTSVFLCKADVDRLHPFGPSFGIDRWDHESPGMGRIDQHQPKQHERATLVLEVLR